MSADRFIDVNATVSGTAAVTSLLAQAMPWLQGVALLIAIVSGSLAIWRHFKPKK